MFTEIRRCISSLVRYYVRLLTLAGHSYDYTTKTSRTFFRIFTNKLTSEFYKQAWIWVFKIVYADGFDIKLFVTLQALVVDFSLAHWNGFVAAMREYFEVKEEDVQKLIQGLKIHYT